MPTNSTSDDSAPIVVVIAGPNGAGKSTSAARLLPEGLEISHFVNADVIAAGLSANAPESVALEAGRIMLERLNELAAQREPFAFETTLSARTYARFLRRLQEGGYQVHLVYVWLDAPELAITRVAERVRRGGHHIPDDTVVRRYQRGISNFKTIYSEIADSWLLCDNSGDNLRVVAEGGRGRVRWIINRETYDAFYASE
jgi:predicted ABC-type ATPase